MTIHFNQILPFREAIVIDLSISVITARSFGLTTKLNTKDSRTSRCCPAIEGHKANTKRKVILHSPL